MLVFSKIIYFFLIKSRFIKFKMPPRNFLKIVRITKNLYLKIIYSRKYSDYRSDNELLVSQALESKYDGMPSHKSMVIHPKPILLSSHQ